MNKMMEDFHKAEKQLMIEKDKLTERLANVLEKNGIKTHMAWFNWSKTNTVCWNNCNISPKLINDLEKEFGEIQCIYTTHRTNNLFIRFKGE